MRVSLEQFEGGGILKNYSFLAGLALLLTLVSPVQAQAWDEVSENPFPGVAFGGEIPAYTKIAICSETPEVPDNCVRRTGQPDCPAWSANDVTPTLRADGSWASAKLWCRASWTAPVSKAAWDAYYESIRAAQEAAYQESLAWNQANPGRQKCVSWGPLIAPDGVGQSSGGVCANPVSAPVAPSGSPSVPTEPVSAGSVGESDVTSPSNASSNSASTSSVSGSVSAPVSSLPTDPQPTGGSSYRGSGYPFTVTLEGQRSNADCPAGFKAANGLIVDIALGKTFTECWPERAWTAYRLGGEAWELFKATAGAYDPSVEIDRRNKVALLKARAQEVAKAAAKLTPGIERCSSWSGFGESGRECAYEFVNPGSLSPVASPDSSSSPSASASAPTPAVTASEPTQPLAGPSAPASESSSVSVELQAVQIAGSSVVVARQALLITPDPEEAASISNLATAIAGLKTVQRTAVQELPRDPSLTYKVVSLTPEICKASSYRVRVTGPGLCQVEIEITDAVGNSYEILRKLRRSK